MASPNPVLSFHFRLSIEGDRIVGLFTECTGIGSEHEVVDHDVVDEKGLPFKMKLPGRLKWENITLKRGITTTMDVWDWRNAIEKGDVEGNRFSGSITMLDAELKAVAQWDFERAWPSKISGPSPKAGGNEIGLEEIVLAHEGIERVQPVA